VNCAAATGASLAAGSDLKYRLVKEEPRRLHTGHMRSFHAASLIVASLVCAGFGSACSAPNPCNASVCPTGCCDQGACYGGTEPHACGSLGNSCEACMSGQVCLGGRCVVNGGGGAGGSGGGGNFGGGTGGGGGGVSGGTVADTQRAVWQAVCDYSTRCGLFSDASRCFQKKAILPNLSPTLHVTANPALVAQCLDSLRTAPCSAAVGPAFSRPWPILLTPACAPDTGDLLIPGEPEWMPFQHLLDGAAAVGDACRTDVECLPNGWCDTSATCPGRCAPRKPVGPAVEGDLCQAGLQLVSGFFDTPQCVDIPSQGEACSIPCGPSNPAARCSVPCELGLKCGASDVCEVPSYKAAGATCGSLFDCEPPLVCLNRTCARPLGPGQLCSSWDCQMDSYCDSRSNVCTRFPGLGEVCDTADCLPGLRCQAADGGPSTCVISTPSPTGGPCSNGCLPSDYCNSGVCARRKTSNMPCSSPTPPGYVSTVCAAGFSCSDNLVCTGCAPEW
jgi:hypothetical protein